MKKRYKSGYIKQKLRKSNETKNNIAAERFNSILNHPAVRRKNRDKFIEDHKEQCFKIEASFAGCKK